VPKRIVDGEALWRSDKIRDLDISVRAEYANLIPLAMSNGVFECSPERVWSLVYSYNRPEFTVEMVRLLLNELYSGGLLYIWKQDKKHWGYFVGIDKPGRLPGVSRRGAHEAVGPSPPAGAIVRYAEETRLRNGYVYFLQGAKTKLVKIGFSRFPQHRARLHQCGSPDLLKLVGLMVADRLAEGQIHRIFAKDRLHGEWFKPSPELLSFVKEKCSLESMDSIEVDARNPDVFAEPEPWIPGFGFGFGLGFGSGFGSGLGENPSATAQQQQQKQQKKQEAEAEIPAAAITAAAFEAFQHIGTKDPFGPTEFQKIWADEYSRIGSGTFTDAMERAAVRCKQAGVKVPPLFFSMKRKIEQIEVENKTHRTPL